MKKNDAFYTEPDVDELGKDSRTTLSIKILKQLQDSLGNVIQLLESGTAQEAMQAMEKLSVEKRQLDAEVAEASGLRVIEGVFDGCNMVGADGNIYHVPPNYASKSRLVEGDLMKLTIRPDGSFIFKQIGPIERQRVIGKLAEDTEAGIFVVIGPDEARWQVLRASVTFYRGTIGDEVVVLVPKSTPSTWAAVENIVRR